MKKKAISSTTSCSWSFQSFSLLLLLAGFLLLVLLKGHGSIVQQQVAADPSSFSGSKPKLAFLFLARNRMPLDFLWEEFFKGSKEHEFTVYIHARPGFAYTKDTTKCTHFYNRQLPRSILVPPQHFLLILIPLFLAQVEWGEATMVEAERLLLKQALEDPLNERFLLLSESCIPLYNFQYIYNYVMASPKSFVDSFKDTRENRYNPSMAPTIPRENWRKGSQWFVLIRKHAEAVAGDEDILTRFREHCKRGALPEFWREYNVNAYKQTGRNCVPDEHYIQTVLSIKGFEHELERRSVSYSLWRFAGRRRRERQGWHPITFTDISMKTLQEIQAIDHIRYDTEWRVEWCSVNGDPHPCFLFARKFTKAAGVKLLNMTRQAATDIFLYHERSGLDALL